MSNILLTDEVSSGNTYWTSNATRFKILSLWLRQHFSGGWSPIMDLSGAVQGPDSLSTAFIALVFGQLFSFDFFFFILWKRLKSKMQNWTETKTKQKNWGEKQTLVWPIVICFPKTWTLFLLYLPLTHDAQHPTFPLMWSLLWKGQKRLTFFSWSDLLARLPKHESYPLFFKTLAPIPEDDTDYKNVQQGLNSPQFRSQ